MDILIMLSFICNGVWGGFFCLKKFPKAAHKDNHFVTLHRTVLPTLAKKKKIKKGGHEDVREWV
jgi:hypothetical protein